VSQRECIRVAWKSVYTDIQSKSDMFESRKNIYTEQKEELLKTGNGDKLTEQEPLYLFIWANLR
jgi:hypothetical protein